MTRFKRLSRQFSGYVQILSKQSRCPCRHIIYKTKPLNHKQTNNINHHCHFTRSFISSVSVQCSHHHNFIFFLVLRLRTILALALATWYWLYLTWLNTKHNLQGKGDKILYILCVPSDLYQITNHKIISVHCINCCSFKPVSTTPNNLVLSAGPRPNFKNIY